MNIPKNFRLFASFVVLFVGVEAAAKPEELMGINLGGLHAGFNTNFFSNLEDGANALLGFGKKENKVADKTGRSRTSGESPPSSDSNIFGVNMLGLKAGIHTNLFDKDGPIAEAENDVDRLAKKGDDLIKNMEDSGSALLNGLFGTGGAGSTKINLSVNGQGKDNAARAAGSKINEPGLSISEKETIELPAAKKKAWKRAERLRASGEAESEWPNYSSINNGQSSSRFSGGMALHPYLEGGFERPLEEIESSPRHSSQLEGRSTLSAGIPDIQLGFRNSVSMSPSLEERSSFSDVNPDRTPWTENVTLSVQPINSSDVVGINVDGLSLNLTTNLLSDKGPIAQIGDEIESGAEGLLNDIETADNIGTASISSLEKSLDSLSNGTFIANVTLSVQPINFTDVIGVNVGGLNADLNTNLLSDNGAIAQIGDDIEAGANALMNGFGKLENGLEGSMNLNLSGQSGDENMFGVNMLGLKAGINTNLFDANGPIAQAENDLEKVSKKGDDLLKNIENSGSAVMNEMMNLGGGSAKMDLSLDGSTRGNVKGLSSMNGELALPTVSLIATESGDSPAQVKRAWRQADELSRSQRGGNSMKDIEDSGSALLNGMFGSGEGGGLSISDKESIEFPKGSRKGWKTAEELGAAGKVESGWPDLSLWGRPPSSSPMDGKISGNMVENVTLSVESTNSSDSVGVDVDGLSINLNTNLFADNGPIAQIGDEIESGAKGLLNDIESAGHIGAAEGSNFLSSIENSLGSLSNGKWIGNVSLSVQPTNYTDVIGIKVDGLNADLDTNLDLDNGPIAQIGDDIEAGANALLKDFGNLENEVEGSLKVNLSGESSGDNIFGVNMLGIKAGIDTNLFDRNGPIAQAENDLGKLAQTGEDILKNIDDGGSAFTNGMRNLLGGGSAKMNLSLGGSTGGGAQGLSSIKEELPLPTVSLIATDLGESPAPVKRAWRQANELKSQKGRNLMKDLEDSGSAFLNGMLGSDGSGDLSISGTGSIEFPSESKKAWKTAGGLGASGKFESNWPDFSSWGKPSSRSSMNGYSSGNMVENVTLSVQSTNDSDSVGVNVDGLSIDLNTNLFADNGPIAQIGDEIESGAKGLLNDIESAGHIGAAESSNFLSSIEKPLESFSNGNWIGNVTLSVQPNNFTDVIGVDVGGLSADLDTNLLLDNGPIAHIGDDIEEGANALLKGFGNLEKGVEGSLNVNLSGKSGGDSIFGVNMLGLKAGIDTNLFDENGPIAQAENDLGKLSKTGDDLLKNIEDSGSAIMNGMTNFLGGGSATKGGLQGSSAINEEFNLPTLSLAETESSEPKERTTSEGKPQGRSEGTVSSIVDESYLPVQEKHDGKLASRETKDNLLKSKNLTGWWGDNLGEGMNLALETKLSDAEPNEEVSRLSNKLNSLNGSENLSLGASPAASDDNLFGFNVLGLKAGLNTNLFDKNGPIDEVGDDLGKLAKQGDDFMKNLENSGSALMNGLFGSDGVTRKALKTEEKLRPKKIVETAETEESPAAAKQVFAWPNLFSGGKMQGRSELRLSGDLGGGMKSGGSLSYSERMNGVDGKSSNRKIRAC